MSNAPNPEPAKRAFEALPGSTMKDRIRHLEAVEAGEIQGRTHGSFVWGSSLEARIASTASQLERFETLVRESGLREPDGTYLVLKTTLGVEDAWIRYTSCMHLLWRGLDCPYRDSELVEVTPRLRQSFLPAGPWRELEDMYIRLTSPSNRTLTSAGDWRITDEVLRSLYRWFGVFLERLKSAKPDADLGRLGHYTPEEWAADAPHGAAPAIQFFGVSDACRDFNVSRNTLYKMCRAGTISARKNEQGKWLIPESELQQAGYQRRACATRSSTDQHRGVRRSERR